MKTALVYSAFVACVVLAAPKSILISRQSNLPDGTNCGGTSYASGDISTAINAAIQDSNDGSDPDNYPHQYYHDSDENITLYCSNPSPWYEFPLEQGYAYTSSSDNYVSPGADRVIYALDDNGNGYATVRDVMEIDSGAPLVLETRPITRLSDACINRIAAGEIIQRPANALKELLENALDAGATKISITAKEGGLKSLIIQDNGSGIRKADLPILCERFTTSKISKYEDLQSLTTYGFRGEALASISHVARLTVTTKTRDDPCGYKAAYSDGKIIPLRAGVDLAEPKPAASNDGTLFQIDDLFWNVLSRRKALRSGSDEYARILDVASKYAVQNAGIAISCKKAGTSSPDLSTSFNSTAADIIGSIYTKSLQNELVYLDMPRNELLQFEGKGHFSSANYSAKKGTFLFFINNRLVDCSALRRAFEAFYTTILPKGGHPFVYFSLKLSSSKVDVNVHPTKSEVFFEDEQEVISAITEALGAVLSSSASMRSIPAVSKASAMKGVSIASVGPSQPRAPTKTAPQKLVRTDATAQTIDSMFGYDATQELSSIIVDKTIDLTREEDDEPSPHILKRPDIIRRGTIKETKCMLTSVLELRAEVIDDVHSVLLECIQNHTLVGLIGSDKPLGAIQHGTKLYLVNHAAFARGLFYQLGLRQFGRIGKFQLQPQPNMSVLIRMAVEQSPPPADSGLDIEEAVERISNRLLQAREMLAEYFSLDVAEDGTIATIPLLLSGYKPDLGKLPLCMYLPLQGARSIVSVLMRAGVEVDWKDEKGCFDTFLRELANFYVPATFASQDDVGPLSAKEQQWQIQHVLYPAFKKYLQPSQALAKNGNLVQMASLEKLYKVFERC